MFITVALIGADEIIIRDFVKFVEKEDGVGMSLEM
jgi:hypothetical protein